MKHILIFLASCLFFSTCFTQELSISAAESAELRKNPDTTNAVIMDKKVSAPRVSQKELDDQGRSDLPNATEDPNNPGVYISEGVTEEKNGVTAQPVRGANGGVLTNLSSAPYTSLEAKVIEEPQISPNSLDAHALALSANCTALKSAGSLGVTVVPFNDAFFVIPTKAIDLPPNPRERGKVGVHGIDKNQNCVRDDIEHYIFRKYPDKDQEKLRLNMYNHAIWLNFFLIKPISKQTIQGIARQNIKTGKCIETLVRNGEGRLARGDLFAHLHDTNQRTERYFENMNVLRGFLIEQDITGTCL